MGWNYSDMSHEAKVNGGPEKWIETVISNSETNGEKKMIPVVAAVGAIGLGLGVLGSNIYHWFKKDKVSDIEAKEAKENLVNELKKSDENIERIEEDTKEKYENDEEV